LQVLNKIKLKFSAFCGHGVPRTEEIQHKIYLQDIHRCHKIILSIVRQVGFGLTATGGFLGSSPIIF